MLQRVLKCGTHIASYGRQKSKLWIPRVMPFLILLGYLEEALLVALHLHVPACLRSFNVIGSICQLADIGIILAGTGLTLIGWHAESGVCLLLLHRSVQRFYDSGMWITDLLEHFVDAGCLLLLLALRLSQRQMLDSNNNIKSSSSSRGIEQAQLQRWLQLGRIGMSCEFLVWFFENQRQVRSNCAALHSLKCILMPRPPHLQVINYRFFSLGCYILMVLGIRCTSMSCLAALCLLWRDCWLTSRGHFFGWNDLTISIQLLSSLLRKVAGFVLLAHLSDCKQQSLDTQALHQYHAI